MTILDVEDFILDCHLSCCPFAGGSPDIPKLENGKMKFSWRWPMIEGRISCISHNSELDIDEALSSQDPWGYINSFFVAHRQYMENMGGPIKLPWHQKILDNIF